MMSDVIVGVVAMWAGGLQEVRTKCPYTVTHVYIRVGVYPCH